MPGAELRTSLARAALLFVYNVYIYICIMCIICIKCKKLTCSDSLSRQEH